MFDKTIYRERRKTLQERVGKGFVLLLGHGESPINFADNCYRFRQDSTFLYYTGISHPDLALLLDCDTGREYLFGDDYTMDQIVWMGGQPSIAVRADQSGIDNAMALSSLKGMVDTAMIQKRLVHFLPPFRHQHQVQLAELLSVPMCAMAGMASQELIKAVVSQRICKSDLEVIQIEKAVSTTVGMHAAAVTSALPGMTESRVAAEVQRVANAFDHELAFPVIATVNGQILHNHFHGNILREGRLFLLDAGAETAMGYAGDLTTTFPVSPTFTPQQRDVYELVLTAQDQAVSLLAPGISFKEIHRVACLAIARGLKDLGLMKGTLEDAVEAGAHALFFPTGLGHLMGLDVHDMENLGEMWVGYDGEPRSEQFGLKSLRLARPLEKGFVLTVEPGIYFIPELMDLWRSDNKLSEFINYNALEAYRDFGGIRNEENYLITENGFRLLGKSKPRTVREIETLRAVAFGQG